MNKELLTSIEEGICEVLAHQCVKDELRLYLDDNIWCSDDGQEMELLPSDFDWEVSLKLKWTGNVEITA